MRYIYNATLIKVIDGDTLELDVDLGFHITVRERFRLYGIDTPEKNSHDPSIRQKGIEATRRLTELCADKRITVETFKQDKYGRYLASVYADTILINDVLLKEDLAVPYFGGVK